jgi:protein SCO1/2
MTLHCNARLTLIAALACCLTSPVIGRASGADQPASAAACHDVPERPRYAVSTARYDVPDVTLLGSDGQPVALRALLASPEPLALNFIFTTCGTICPVMTATFAQMRRELGEAGERLRLVSISIDPEQDRPEVLRRYAERFGAGRGWTFLTGAGPDVERVQRAFAAYAGSKMNHRPLTLLKARSDAQWVRIDGLASGGTLAHEVETRLLN